MTALAKLLWYKHRLQAMSTGEILHRLYESMKRGYDRVVPHALPSIEKHYALPTIPGLRESLEAWNVPEALMLEWQEHAARAKAQQFFLLGVAWPENMGADKWHLDPVSGSQWPSGRFCFAINYRHAENMGDVKYIWELSRLQYLQPVAALAFKTKDKELAAFCLEEIESWINHNPPYQGVHWASGIELGLRVVSVLLVMTLVGEYASHEQREKIHASLQAHGYWLSRYPSKFSSANNHVTAEGLGLFLLGALCPDFSKAKQWKWHGWRMLCETADKQILSDGVGAEQTPNYTAVVLEMLLLGLTIAQSCDVEVPAYYRQKMALGGEYLRWFMDANGNVPRIGDDDNARVIGAYALDEHYIPSMLGCIAALCNRADLTPPLHRPYLRNALFGLPPVAENSPQGVRIFEEGGYTVGRHQANGQEILLVMDHGYLGYLSIAAHGHADALSLWLHIGGQPVLVDAGTYLYHSGGKWRKHFRGTQAHNTLTLEGADQSIMAGHFNWSHKASATLKGSEVSAKRWWVEASHDGYEKRFGATHHRRLEVAPSTGFAVEDWLTGKGGDVEIGFLLHPSLHAQSVGGGIELLKNGEVFLRLRHEGLPHVDIYAAGSEQGGWYSPTFGLKETATRIVFSGHLKVEQKVVTQFSFGQAHG